MRVMLRTYVLALAGLIIVGFGVLYATSLFSAVNPGYGEPRPTEAQLRGYTVEYRLADGAPDATLQVDTDGAACAKLSPSETLAKACVLALNVDPAFIAGEAFGRLNNEDTVAYEAIIWRARLDGDAAICEAGGLLDARLAACRDAVAAEKYTRTDHGVTATVPSPS